MPLKYYVDERRCQKCSFWETSEAKDNYNQLYRRSGVYGKGTGKNGLLIVGTSINAASIVNNLNFNGPGGTLLNNTLLKAGINPQDCYFTTLMRCKLPGNLKPKVPQLRVCHENNGLLDLPRPDWEPKLVLLLGNAVLQVLTKEQKISERRGQFFKVDFLGKQYSAIATFDPSVVLYSSNSVSTIELDIRRSADYINGLKYDELAQHDRNFAYKREDILAGLQELMSLPEDTLFSCDIETTGLDNKKDDITSISFTYRIEETNTYKSLVFMTMFRKQDVGSCEYVVLRNPFCPIRNTLKFFLESRKFVFHGGDFDCRFLWKYQLFANYDFDTIDSHLLLEETEPHKLKYLVKKFIASGAGYEKSILDEVDNEPGDYCKADKESLFTYNSDDSYFTLMLFYMFEKRLQKEKLYNFYSDHAMRLRRTMTKISYRGILVDKNKLFAKAEEYRGLIKVKREELYESAGEVFNEGSTQQVARILFDKLGLPILARTDTGAPSTGQEVLVELENQSPVVKLLTEIRHLKKMCSTYLDGKTGTKDEDDEKNGLLPYIDSNSRLHCRYFTEGTNSGRLSARSPNMQNIPKESDLRNIFVAPPGWKLLEIDYRTAELVLLAYLSGDANFIKAVNSRDLHADSARTLLGVLEGEEVDDTTRTLAKRINFRKAYRGGPRGLAEQMGISLQEAYDWYAKWDATYPDIIKWFQFQDNFWKKNRYIESIYGRKRRFPDFSYLLNVNQDDYKKRSAFYDRIAVNFPCQSAVAETTNRTMYLFEEALEESFGLWYPDNRIYERPGIVLTVHDSIIVECPDYLVDEVTELLSYYATLRLPKINIPLAIDIKVSQCWQQKKTDEIEV